MSKIIKYKKQLNELHKFLEDNPNYPIHITNKNKNFEDNGKDISYITWSISEGYLNLDSIMNQDDNFGIPYMFTIKSYPFTLCGEEWLKTENEKHKKIVTDEAVKSIGNQIGKWGLFGFVMIVMFVIFYFLNN